LEAAGPEVEGSLRLCFTLPVPRKLRAFGPGAALVPHLPGAVEAHRTSGDARPLREWLERLPGRAERKPQVRPLLERLVAEAAATRVGALATYREARRLLALPCPPPEDRVVPERRASAPKGQDSAPLALTNEDRFRAQVVENEKKGCWRWTGRAGPNGRLPFAFRSDGASRRAVVVDARTWAFEHFLRPLPEGRVAWAFCGKRRCVSPEHLVAITPEMAALLERKHCPAGHPFAVRNLVRGPHGPACRTCSLQGRPSHPPPPRPPEKSAAGAQP
jgi:hypothetical protein